MTTNSENDSRQNLWASNIAKSMMSEGDSALLPSNVDRQPQLLILFLSGPVIKCLIFDSPYDKLSQSSYLLRFPQNKITWYIFTLC